MGPELLLGVLLAGAVGLLVLEELMLALVARNKRRRHDAGSQDQTKPSDDAEKTG